MVENGDLRTLASLLEDESAHAILLHTSTQVMSAAELSDACDASVSTIYRRLDRLQERALVAERLQLDREGHHYRTDTARLERIEIELVDDEFDSGSAEQNGSFEHTFDEAGTFYYYCDPHRSIDMKGAVVVESDDDGASTRDALR